MTIDLPPQIPPAIIEFVKQNDYLPDKYIDLNTDKLTEYINLCKDTYKGYNIFRLGYIDKIDKDFVGYNYKNCYLLLSNNNETRCATPEEEQYIILHHPNLAKKYTSDIPIDVIKLVRIYGEPPKIPEEYWIGVPDYIDQLYYYHSMEPIMYKDYTIYYIGFPSDEYSKQKCEIIIHNDKETRCATEHEYFRIMIPMKKYKNICE